MKQKDHLNGKQLFGQQTSRVISDWNHKLILTILKARLLWYSEISRKAGLDVALWLEYEDIVWYWKRISDDEKPRNCTKTSCANQQHIINERIFREHALYQLTLEAENVDETVWMNIEGQGEGQRSAQWSRDGIEYKQEEKSSFRSTEFWKKKDQDSGWTEYPSKHEMVRVINSGLPSGII